MRYLPLVVFGAVAAFATGASAQSINLTALTGASRTAVTVIWVLQPSSLKMATS